MPVSQRPDRGQDDDGDEDTGRFAHQAFDGRTGLLGLLDEGRARRSDDALPRLSAAYAPERVASVIGVSADHIRRLARAFAQARQAVALAGSPYSETPEAVEAAVAANLLNYAVGSPLVDFGQRQALRHCADAAQEAGLELRAAFGAADFYEYVRNEWRGLHREAAPEEEFECFWTDSLRRGGYWGDVPSEAPELAPGLIDFRLSAPTGEEGIKLHAYPPISLYDGRAPNKPWLQELPDAIPNAVWGSWVGMPEEEARELGVWRGEMVQVSGRSGSVRAPVVPCPGLARGAVAVPLGQGHSAYGRNAEGVGANALPLVAFAAEEGALTVTVERVGEHGEVVTTAGSSSQHGRGIAQTVSLSRLGQEAPEPLHYPLPEGYDLERDLHPAHEHAQRRWAMVIDLNRCTGCGACVTACYAENNVAVVGREEVAKGREMSWLRIERYLDWDSEHTPVLFIPMLCQHCDAAPCEPVCPVYAAVHSDDGLNSQIYHPCVGTRSCANNCPYKARRFNWFDQRWPEPLNWQLNPEVTVRCRGVMGKCTFCVQRIREGEQRAKAENRAVRDGDIVPACAQTCPAEAIVFGDLMDSGSRVRRLIRDDPRAYQVLGELNTKPAVVYLKRVVNDEQEATETWGN